MRWFAAVVVSGLLAGGSASAAPAATRGRLVIDGAGVATATVTLREPVDVDPARLSVRGGGRVAGVYLAGLGRRRATAGFLVTRADVRSRWEEPIVLGRAERLPPGSYRVTVVGDAPVELSLPLRGAKTVRVRLRPSRDGRLLHWRGDTRRDGPRQAFRTPVDVTAHRLVVVGVRYAATGAAATATGACLTLTGSICRVGGVRPLGTVTVPARDGTSEVIAIYEPGDVAPGSYDAVVESAQVGGAGTTSAFLLDSAVR